MTNKTKKPYPSKHSCEERNELLGLIARFLSCGFCENGKWTYKCAPNDEDLEAADEIITRCGKGTRS